MVSMYKTTHWYKDRVHELLTKLKEHDYSLDSLMIFEHCLYSTEDLFISKVEDVFYKDDYSNIVKFFLPKLTISYYLDVSKFSKLFFSPKKNNISIKDLFYLGKCCAVFDSSGEPKFLLKESFCTPVVFIKKDGYEIKLCNHNGILDKVVAHGNTYNEYLADLSDRKDFYILNTEKVSKEKMYANIRKNILFWFRKKNLNEHDMFMVRNFRKLKGKKFVDALLK